MPSKEKPLSMKLLLIGDSAVGKTCMLLKYAQNNFQADHMSTIGVDFKIKRTEVEGVPVHLNIWDTAGQERFKHITKSFYKGADGILICYGLDDRDSFAHIESWLGQVKDLADQKVQMLLVANKVDVAARAVTSEEGRELAARCGLDYFETSAKTGTGIEETFRALTLKILKNSNVELLQKKASRLSVPEPEAKSTCC